MKVPARLKADQIFSALYIEALKLNLQQQLYDAVKKEIC